METISEARARYKMMADRKLRGIDTPSATMRSPMSRASQLERNGIRPNYERGIRRVNESMRDAYTQFYAISGAARGTSDNFARMLNEANAINAAARAHMAIVDEAPAFEATSAWYEPITDRSWANAVQDNRRIWTA